MPLYSIVLLTEIKMLFFTFTSLEPPDVTGSSLTLGAAGSRRTVYLVDENSKLPDSTTATSPSAAAATASTDADTSAANNNNNNNNGSSSENNPTASATDHAPSTFLMYNRISNIIGDPKIVGTAASLPLSQETALGNSPTNGSNDKRKPDDNAVWYEYGCV